MVPRVARLAKRAGPTCVANAETWWNNDQGATPCDVYQSILDKCGYTAPAITSDESYYPVLSAQECMCNTITYNLGSACRDCQRGTTDQGILVSNYVAGGDGCLGMDINLPATVTPTDDIPFWALLDTSTQFWSYDAAKEIALNTTTTTTSSQPSSTGSTDPSSSMSATPTLTPTQSPTTSPGAAPVTSGHKSTNAGAIGGGVGGGVVALLLIIGLLLLWRRRRARQSYGGGEGMVMGAATEDGGRNPSASSESSLTESGKGVGVASHYTPHSQMAQLHHNGSGVVVGSYSSASALSTPVDAPPMPSIPREHATPTPARSLAASPTPSQPTSAITNKVKRVPVRYSEDELAQAEQAEIEARKVSGQQ